jgi:hypothetical protein
MSFFRKLFVRRNKWNAVHNEFWKIELEQDEAGCSIFQRDCVSRVEFTLNGHEILYSIEKIELKYELDKKGIATLISFRFAKDGDSKIWVYNDMAEFDISGTHKIFEEWGFLKPSDLKEEFIEALIEEINKNSTQQWL